MAFYLWKKDAATDYLPVRLGEVQVDGSEIRLVDCHEPGLQKLVDDLRARSSLNFRVERKNERGDLVMSQEEARPSDPAFEMALFQALQQEGGVRCSFSPEYE